MGELIESGEACDESKSENDTGEFILAQNFQKLSNVWAFFGIILCITVR